jgi:hypothetical protein
MLFSEMGYDSEVSKIVDLAGRGKKEIDVFVKDKLASINQIYLIECKYWEHKVPQEVIHSFKTVMDGVGANTGFVISKKGFQKGSYEAVKFTNIHLFTFEQLQHKYGEEWYRKKKDMLMLQYQDLKYISHLHFDQFNKLPFYNNMFFHTEELVKRLVFYNHLIGRFLITKLPESYLGPEPIKIYFNPSWEFNDNINFYDDFELTYNSTREFFNEMISGAQRCILGFRDLDKNASESFNALDENSQNELMTNSLQQFTDETPIRVLKNYMDKDEYLSIIKRISKNNI